MTGGRADKLGNRYEEWWMVLQLIRLVDDDIESICIEDPSVDKSECLIACKSGEELHQNKRSRSSGSWTLNQLGEKNEKILSAIFTQLEGSTRKFYFVSGSDAPELKALSDQARITKSLADFENQVLTVEKHKKDFDQLKTEWGSPENCVFLDVLKRIFVRVLDEEAILDQIASRLRSLFLTNPNSIRSTLREFVLDRIGETLLGNELRTELTNQGHRLRNITDGASASRKLDELTEQYLAESRRRLIGKRLIPRETSKQILKLVRSASTRTDILLLSEAGGGKSACLMEVVEHLKSENIPVLAFRLDRLQPTTTGFQLGHELGLEESPAFIMSGIKSDQTAVIVIDQLDAVSTASGRSSESINAVEAILEEVRDLNYKRPVHVILACRRFDLENDHRLRRLVEKKENCFNLGDFSSPEVAQVLKEISIDSSSLNERQLTLLMRPQNLSLFSELREYSASVTSFGSTKDLFDAYWDQKQKAVLERSSSDGDDWSKVIDLLVEKMTKDQLLSVQKEILDEIPQNYLEQMISEGVISLQVGRYGFGHESFFDYCFARRFVRKNDSLLDVLKSSEQHLFRRAQVRQVLAYLKDSNFTRYLEQLKELLKSPNIRIHLKSLTLSLLAATPKVEESEWVILEPWLNQYLESVKSGGTSQDSFTNLVWQNFFYSSSWFLHAHAKGWPQDWLIADDEYLPNLGTNYLKRHQRDNGDLVASMLKPFRESSDLWKERLKLIMQWASFQSSRPMFELFLELVENGVMDDAKGPIAVNSTFWDLLHGLEDTHPDWVMELLVIWLRRRLQICVKLPHDESGQRWSELFPHDQSGAMIVSKAATDCPNDVIEKLLPMALQISEESSNAEDSLPRYDSVWGISFGSSYPDLRQVCVSSIHDALDKMAKNFPKSLRPVIDDLQERTTYFANGILLRIYTAGAENYAEEALTLLEADPWRLRCGYSDSSYWVARGLIGSIAPHLSEVRMNDLEKLILGYRSTWEKSKNGRKFFGDAVHILSGDISKNLLSESGRKRVEELDRKFGEKDSVPRGIRGGTVVSPIPEEAEKKMTDAQWRSAISKYSAEDRDRFRGDFLKGGARELASSMQPLIKNEPERFARLALTLPTDTNPIYFDWILTGLTGTTCSVDLKLEVVRRIFEQCKVKCGRSLADILGSIKERLADEFVDMLHWIAIEHPNPRRELWKSNEEHPTIYYGGSISDSGLNSDRGRAVLAIAQLIQNKSDYIERFSKTLDRLVDEEKTLSVKSCGVRVAASLIGSSKEMALKLFLDLTQENPALLSIKSSDHFLAWAIQDNFELVEPSLLAMLRSEEEKESEAGARLLSLAKLYSQPVDDFIEEALQGQPSQRLGLAKVAARNISQSDSRVWCERILGLLFSDFDEGVRGAAASCFRELSEVDLSLYNRLVVDFSVSPSFQSNPSSLMRVLEETKFRLPDLTMDVCENFILQISTDNTHPFSTNYIDDSSLGTLVFRIYQQYQDADIGRRALDLIDEMIKSGLGEAERCLGQFER